MIIPAFGGLIILSYLGPLGFVPDFDLSEMLGLLVLSAFLGLLPLAMLGTGLLMPALMLNYVFAGKISVSKMDDRRYYSIILPAFLIWPFLIIPGLFYETGWVFFALILPPLITLIFPHPKEKEAILSSAWVSFILTLTVGASFLFAFIMFIPGASSGLADDPPYQQWAALLVWGLSVGAFNISMLRSNKEKFSLFFIFATTLIFLLIFLTRSLSYVHILAIQKMQLGDIRNATITVNESASAVLQAACPMHESSSFTCTWQQFRQDKQGTRYTYESITILSRIGNQYYLQLCPSLLPNMKPKPCDANAENLPRVVIDKKDVLGWSTHKIAKQDKSTSEK